MSLYVSPSEQEIVEGEASVKGKDRTPGLEDRLFVIIRNNADIGNSCRTSMKREPQ